MIGLSSRVSKSFIKENLHQTGRALILFELLYFVVIWRCFSQTVVFLYLLDEKTSLLVLVPAGIASVIEVCT